MSNNLLKAGITAAVSNPAPFKAPAEPADDPRIALLAKRLEDAAQLRVGFMDSDTRMREYFERIRLTCEQVATELRAL